MRWARVIVITSVIASFGVATAVAMRGHTRVAASPRWDVAGERKGGVGRPRGAESA